MRTKRYIKERREKNYRDSIFSQFSLYQRLFLDILTDYIIFLEFLVNRPKIFKIDVFLSQFFFVGGLMVTFYQQYYSNNCLVSLFMLSQKKNLWLGFLPSKLFLKHFTSKKIGNNLFLSHSLCWSIL